MTNRIDRLDTRARPPLPTPTTGAAVIGRLTEAVHKAWEGLRSPPPAQAAKESLVAGRRLPTDESSS